MNTITRRPKQAKGAVLIMVLTIMTVLILLLAGTISVVYSAHNRALKKYTESQAYYTARSVVDEYVEGLMPENDNTNPAKINGSNRKYYYVGDNGSGTLEEKDIAMTQGRALELDLYSVPVSTVSNSSDPNYNQWYKEEIVDKGLDSKYVNLTTSTFGGSYTFPNVVNQFITGDWGTSYVRGQDDTFKYKVGSLDNFGYDVSTGNRVGVLADAASEPTITVQILERKFNLGAGSDFREQFMNGDRSKDYFKIKVTGQIQYGSETYTTSAILCTSTTEDPGAANAIVSLSDIAGSDTVTAFGGASSLSRASTAWTNNANTSSNLFFQGGVNTGTTTAKFNLNSKSIMFVRGNLYVGNKIESSCIKTGATFYAKNIEFNPSVNSGFGDSSHQVNIICERLTIPSKDAPIDGQIFANELNVFPTSNTGGSNVIRDHDPYCKFFGILQGKSGEYKVDGGAIDIAVGAKIGGAVLDGNANTDHCLAAIDNSRVVNVSNGFVLYSDVNTPQYKVDVRNNKVYTWDNSTHDWSQTVSGITINTPVDYTLGKVSLDTTGTEFDYSYESVTTVGSDAKKEIPLPTSLINGSTKASIDTVQSLYGIYFKDSTTGGTYPGDTWTAAGDFNLPASTPDPVTDPTGYTAVLNAFIAEHVLLSEDVLNENNLANLGGSAVTGRDESIELSYPMTQQIPSGYSQVIGYNGDGATLSNNFGTVAVDCRSANKYVVLGDGNGGDFYGELVVFGDKNCYVILPANSAGTEYKFGGNGQPFEMWDADLGSGNSISSVFIEGASPATPAPNIKVFASQDVSKVTIGQGCKLNQGYFYAPKSDFEMGGGANGKVIGVYTGYSSGNINNNSVSVIGSVFCKSYGGAQKPGVCFIDPQTQNINQGQTLFSWKTIRRQIN